MYLRTCGSLKSAKKTVSTNHIRIKDWSGLQACSLLDRSRMLGRG